MDSYTITELVPPAQANWMEAFDLNEGGVVVGASGFYSAAPVVGNERGTIATIWSSGSPILLDSPGSEAIASRVNDPGDVIGLYGTLNIGPQGGIFPNHGFLYSNGGMTEFGSVTGASGTDHAYVSDINNQRQVVGSIGNTGTYQVFLYDATTQSLNILGRPPGYASARPNAINESGQIVGEASDANDANGRMFVYHNGVFTDLGVSTFFIEDLSDTGLIVGNAPFNNQFPPRAFLYDLNNQPAGLQDLGLLGFPGHNTSRANAVNNSRVIVGTSGEYYNGTSSRAFLYENGVMADLTMQVDPSTGWVLENAVAINDAGQILARGRHNGVPSTCLLTPKEQNPFHSRSWSIIMTILFGVIEGGGGLGWLPGKGPVPIDPEGWRQLSPATRDMLIGLALTEMSSVVNDVQAQQDIQRAGIRVMERALKTLGKR